ncbi:outer membrane protein transport protein [bacterium]|nr:outer membrane protein transport protein [bacterium]
MRRFAITLIWFFTHVLLPRLAQASPLDMYGFGARARGMASAQTAAANDFSALYYNPAALIEVHATQVRLGIVSADPTIDIDLKRASGISNRQAKVLRDMEEAAEDVPTITGYDFGIVLSPFEIFKAGLALYVPERRAVILRPIDTHRPTPILHDHYAQRAAVFVGGAIEAFPGLSVGLGTHVFIKVRGHLVVPIEGSNKQPLSDEIDSAADLTIDFPFTAEPFFGLYWKPKPWIRFGASYRSQFEWDVEIDAELDLVLRNYVIDLSRLADLAPGLMPLRTVLRVSIPALGDTPIDIPIEIAELSGVVVANLRMPIEASLAMDDLWQPRQLSAGVAVDPTDQLTVSLDGTWYDWSGMPSPDMDMQIEDIHVQFTTLPANIQARIRSLTVPVLGTLASVPSTSLALPGMDIELDIPLRFQRQIRPPVHDVIHPRIGAEYRFPAIRTDAVGDIRLSARGGYAYEPSPFGTDAGYTNLIDPDRHLFASGFGAMFNDHIGLDAHFQFRYLARREFDKDTVDEAMPFTNVAAEGYILSGGTQISFVW